MRRRMRGWIWLLVLALLLGNSRTVWAMEGEERKEDEDVTLAPYFYIDGVDPTVDHLPLKSTEVKTTINGMIADTYVTQIYANEGKHAINASYVFPASTRVSVHGMTMQVGDQILRAQIKEKEEAKAEFEEAKSEGKSASLLEEKRANVFTMDVANIMPGDVISIELHYTEMIESTEGVYSFVFPTVVGPRYARPMETDSGGDDDDWVSIPYLVDDSMPEGSYDISVKLSGGVPLKGITSPSHEISVKQDDDTEAQVTLSNPRDYAGNRDFILEYELAGEELGSGLMLYEGEEENFFLLTVQPPKRYEPEDIPDREYIFVLDVSGSMDGYPLDTAKVLIRDLVRNLQETDRFNVVLFSDRVSRLAMKSVEATRENIVRAIRMIDQQEGGGGTEMEAALKLANAIPRNEGTARSVIVISDGFISSEEDVFGEIRDHLDTTSFFGFGIGTAVNRYLMEGIAKVGMGESFIVTDDEEAQETAERFRTYVQAPLLTDIQVDFQGFDAYDIEPEQMSTLFAQKPVVLFGKWRGEATGNIRISGKTGNEIYRETIEVKDTEAKEEHEALQYLWARKRVERLTDYGINQEKEEAKAEVTALGLRYHMATPYTSFVAVLDTVRNPEGDSRDVNQPSALPKGVSELSIGGYRRGPEPGDWLLIAAALTVAFLGMRRKRREAL